jgi:DNA-binding transcriptional LysR family regulator
MTFTQLEIFVLVAELQGFTSAAVRLGISQSAVSHAIKSLEQEWEVDLIERRQGNVEITEVGQRLLRRAREILGLSEAMRQEIAAVRGLNQGFLRIGSFGPTSSLKLLPAILGAYQKRYPGIEVRLDEAADNDVIQWLLDRRVDIGFVVLPEERFDTVPLVEDHLMALVCRHHPLARRASVALKDLADQPFIMSDAGCSAPIEPVFVAEKVTPQVRYRMSQVLTILGMVERGYGVSILAELALPDDMTKTHPGIVALPLKPAVKRRVGLAMRDIRQAAPAALAFLECAREVTTSTRFS